MKHLFPGATGHFSLIQGCYWMTYCILISFSSLYLLDRGFTNTQIGLLLGIAGLTAAILQPFVGAKGDHLKILSLRQFTSLPIAAMILCGVGLFLVPAKPVQAALYMVLLVLLQLLTPLIYSLGMDCLNNHIELNFGLARGIGGGTYALASAVCGSLAAALGARVIPLVLVVAVALMLAFTFTFRQGGPVKSTLPKPDALPQSDGTPFLKKYPQVLPLLIGVILLYTSHNVIMNFPYQIVQSLGCGSAEMGHYLTLQSLMDIPAMVVFSLLLKRASSRAWVRLTGISFFLHALLTWLAPNLPFLMVVQVFEMSGYALYSVSSVYFVNEMVGLCDRVQGQTYFTMANTIGIVLSSVLGGRLLDLGGASAALCLATVTGAAGMVILWFLLRRKSLRPATNAA